MSNLGVIATRLDVNSRTLKEFDESLHVLRKNKNQLRSKELEEKLDTILKILKPISDGINDNLSASEVNENNIINILREQHDQEWQRYQENIQRLTNKLSSGKFQLEEQDFQLLEDIADALDAECEYLFQRLSERR